MHGPSEPMGSADARDRQAYPVAIANATAAVVLALALVVVALAALKIVRA